MGFKAASAVEALDFDFRPQVDASGVIPEPTHDLRDAFLTRIDEIFADDTDKVLEDRVADIKVEELRKLEGELVDAVAELCQGTPTREQIGGLPPRHQLAFLGWLVGQLAADPTQAATQP